MKLTRRKHEAADVESFVFEPSEPVSWQAGQFLHWVLHHEPTDDRGSDRWFTVSAAPSEGHVMLTTRFTEGKGSSFKRALAELAVGSEAIEVSDVDGDFTVEGEGPFVFIAGGIGVTPFRSILRELDHRGAAIRATVLYGNRDEDIPFAAELDELAKKHAGLVIEYVIAPAKIDEARIRDALVPGSEEPTYYVSGPEPMVEAMYETLKGMGIPGGRLKGDWFPGYPAD